MLSLEKQILFLVLSSGSASVQRLVEIYEARGVAHQMVRNSLSRLKKDGYLRSAERSSYEITELGADFVTTINRKPRATDAEWDGHWYTVLFEVPEAERKKRDAFRNDLLQLGFGLWFKSVYVSPWDYSAEALRFAEHHGIGDRVAISRGTFVHNGLTASSVQEIWPLAALNRTYREKRAWFETEFKPSLPLGGEGGEAQALSLLVRFLELGELMAELGLNDPMLPAELLPDDWAGTACYEEMQACLLEIAGAIPADSAYRPFVARLVGE